MLAIWPGLCLTTVVYGINMFGDALRDLLDPLILEDGGPPPRAQLRSVYLSSCQPQNGRNIRRKIL